MIVTEIVVPIYYVYLVLIFAKYSARYSVKPMAKRKKC